MGGLLCGNMPLSAAIQTKSNARVDGYIRISIASAPQWPHRELRWEI
jgi:hypothetical protein